MQNVDGSYKKENIFTAFFSLELVAAAVCMYLFFQTIPRYDTGASDGADTSMSNSGPDIIERAMELPPGAMLAEGKIEEASNAASNLLAKKKHDTLANICAGNVFFLSGSKADGLKLLKNAVALSHRNRYVIENYAERLAESGQLSDAEAQFEVLAAGYPEWQKPHLELAKLYMVDGKPGQAAEQFKKVLDSNERNFAVRKLRAICLARSNQMRQGLDEYVKASSEEAQSGIPQAIRSILGDGKKSVDRDRVAYELNQMVQNKPDEYVPKLRLAQLYEYENQLNEAQDLLMDARRQQPNNPEIHRTLAVVQSQLGEDSQALSSFALSVKLETAQEKAHTPPPASPPQ